jgi:hypothetical protein
MSTQCKRPDLRFHPLGRKEIRGRFDGGTITSDAGGLLLREVDQRTWIIDQFAACFTDYRHPDFVEHSVRDLVAQRVYGLALGYEDLNDHDDLRRDPLLATLVGKKDPEGKSRRHERDEGKALAGKSTLNRLELTPEDADGSCRYKKIAIRPEAVDELFITLFLQAHRRPPKEIVLDLDATDDPLYGHQEGRFFHGYYKHYCYLPLYIFCGEHLLCARLRESNVDGAFGAVDELQRIVGKIRQAWPKVKVMIRADSGFCREEILKWCEDEDVGYVVGIAKNSRLIESIQAELDKAKALFEKAQEPARLFKDFTYQTRTTWSRERRVIGKAEHLAKGSNPRFLVTSLSTDEAEARWVYEDLYCIRGDMENRIKEQQLYLFADRTSTQTMHGNQIRLWFSSVAYVLMHALRRLALRGTAMARAQCHTIRLKLLKIGAQIRVTARRVWVSMAEGYPYREIFVKAFANLRGVRPLRI